MKRSILSPLCSAFIIPGLGQILNQELKKGLILLTVVFLLFIAGTIELAVIIYSLFENQVIDLFDTDAVMARLQDQNLFLLWLIIVLFGIVWIYSILDAFLKGRTIDRDQREDIQ